MAKDLCGCICNDVKWIKICGPHQMELDERRVRWNADRERIIEIKCHRLNGRVVSGAASPPEKEEEPKDTFYEIDEEEPKIISKRKKATKIARQPKSNTQESVVKTPKVGSKLEQAFNIYKTLTDKSRKNVINIFVHELQMTPASASTYQNQCKKLTEQ